MAERKRKGLEVHCKDNEDVEEEAGCSTNLKKRVRLIIDIENTKKSTKTHAWLRCEVDKRTNLVVYLYCDVCRKYEERMQSMKNYTNTWVTGSTNQKVSNLTAHATSDTHKAAMIRLRVESAKAKGESTAMLSPIAACFLTLDGETRVKMRCKFDVCYLMAKENIPFVKYPALLDLETRHGVDLGLAYSTPG